MISTIDEFRNLSDVRKKEPLLSLVAEPTGHALLLCPTSSQALSACSDHSLLEVPPAPLSTLVPQGVRLPRTISENKKWAPVGTHFYFHGGGGTSPSIITEKAKWIDLTK